jgi:hypothetical protein
MRESNSQALRDLQDVFQQAAINYNVDPATHVIPGAPPRVPLNALPKPASPAASPRVGTIEPSRNHLPSSLLTEPSVIQGCMTAPRHLLCQNNWISWENLFHHNVSCHIKARVQTHQRSEPHPCHSSNHTDHSEWLPFGTLLTMTPLHATHKVAHRYGPLLRRPS